MSRQIDNQIKTNIPKLPLAPWAKALQNMELDSPKINKKKSNKRIITSDSEDETIHLAQPAIKSPFQSPRSKTPIKDYLSQPNAPLRRSSRIRKATERFEELSFIPGANNGYTRGRRIDPGFSIRTSNEFYNETNAIRAIRNEANLKGFVDDKIHYMSKEEYYKDCPPDWSEEELTDAETTEEELEFSEEEVEVASDPEDQIAQVQHKRLHNSSAYRGKVNTYATDRDTDHFSDVESDGDSDYVYSGSQEDSEDSEWESGDNSSSEEEKEYWDNKSKKQTILSCPKKSTCIVKNNKNKK